MPDFRNKLVRLWIDDIALPPGRVVHLRYGGDAPVPSLSIGVTPPESGPTRWLHLSEVDGGVRISGEEGDGSRNIPSDADTILAEMLRFAEGK